MSYTIQKLATLAGVSVRTLHYYDAIDLLKPSEVAENGYRHYTAEALDRLQQILFFRELKFPLERIKQILAAPDFNRTAMLEHQRELLQLERDRLDQVLQTVDKTLISISQQQPMQDEELYGGLSRQKIDEYTEEARERWGNTKAFKQSQDRLKGCSKEQYAALAKESEELVQELADAMEHGFDSPEAQAAIDRNFQMINERFYDCSLEMFHNLAIMTTEDQRFADYYRRFHPDLPEFRRKAVEFYCAASG